MTCLRANRPRDLAADERGIALLMALGMLIVLAIVTASLLDYSLGNQHTSVRQSATVSALALAEQGLNDGFSVLNNAPNPSDPSTLPFTTVSVSAGTISYQGTLSGTTWTITGTGTVANPAAAGSTVTRTVSQQASILASANPLWSYLYSDATSGCLNVGNNSVLTANLYVRGNLCLSNNSHIAGSDTLLQVGGTLSLGSGIGATVGYPTTPIASAKLAGGCITSGSTHTCSQSDGVYATTLSQTVDPISKPPADFAYWYQNANPGPKHTCTIGSIPGGFDNDSSLNTSLPTFELTPSNADYSCKATSQNGTVVGELSWNRSTSTLTINGTIFIDGNLTVSSKATYQGLATLYTSGTLLLNNNATLCGTATCDSNWNPTQNLLVTVAGGTSSQYTATIANNAIYQGAIWAANDYQVLNNGQGWGPVAARQLSISNNSHVIPLTILPAGTPGITSRVTPIPGTWSGN